MRRNAANNLGNTGEMDVDEITSDEADDDMDSDDVGEPEEFFGPGTYELPQQQDFVGLT